MVIGTIGITSVLTVVVALVAVLGLIWLAGRAARFGGMARRPATGGLLSVQDVLALDARRRLHLIKCDERRVLLLTGGAHDVVVGWLDREPPS
ncbi:MAG TPA: flagellar biosynthetic protein FliO [Acetobacteraceae bacterium]|jgi:flagellar protein FliO/FliZ|nr:flagellar biosynthetic protein FliO [Acetobacteraceae bacterium]